MHLLGADERRVEDDDQVTGKVCETFVAGELLKQASWADADVRLYHYQRDREDVDLVLENRRGDIAAVEVKGTSHHHGRGTGHWIAKLRDSRGEQFRAGAIVYSGAQTLPLGDRLWAVPFAALWA